MKPAWYKKREPVIAQVERLPDGYTVYRYTEFSPMTGRSVSKYGVAWYAYSHQTYAQRIRWFPTIAAAKMAHAMAPVEPRFQSDDMVDAYTYLLQRYHVTGTGVTKCMVGTP